MVLLSNEWGTPQEMITSRNKTSHTYNEEVAREIAQKIVDTYFDLFTEFQQTMEAKRSIK